MIKKISNYSNTIRSLAASPVKDVYNKFVLPKYTADVFERTIPATNYISDFVPYYYFKEQEINSETISKLSEAQIQQLLKLANKKVEAELPQKVTRFCNLIKDGLDNKFGENNYVFVSIGQSPAVLAEILKLKGIETTICPVSGLSKCNMPDILKNPELHKYFEYLEEIGLSPNKIKNNNKQYVFTDYCLSGKSLSNFEKMLEKNGYKLPNVHFIPLQKIPRMKSKLSFDDKKFVRYFVDKYIHTCRLKNKFSPSFALLAKNLHLVKEFKRLNHVNEDFNMLKFLILIGK